MRNRIYRSSYLLLLFACLLWVFKVSEANPSPVSDELPHKSDASFDFTRDCTVQARFRDCAVFNRCCEERCNQRSAAQRQQFCMALVGEIQAPDTHCVCKNAGRYKRASKFNVLLAAVFVFLTDLVLITFAF